MRKIDSLVRKNKKLILDYTDNHFTKEGIVGDFYREIKDFVSGLILPSQKMRANIIDDWDRFTAIIPEPVEVDFIEPEREKPDYQGNDSPLVWSCFKFDLSFGLYGKSDACSATEESYHFDK